MYPFGLTRISVILRTPYLCIPKTHMMNLKTFSVIYDRYKASELSIKDFCNNECILESRFYYWQRRYRANDAQREAHSGFVPLVLNSSGFRNKPAASMPTSEIGQKPSGSYEIVYPNGVCLRLPSETDTKQVESFILLYH